MDYCKYHPLAGATYHCKQCETFQCDSCVDEDTHQHEKSYCFVCGDKLESLGSVNTIEPFWRRLRQAFKYPLNSAALSLILICAVISLIATLIPALFIVAIVLQLFAASAMMKYNFVCLERSALGEMKAPEVRDAYQGGLMLLLQIVMMGMVLSLVVGLSYYYLGPALGGFFGLIAVLSIPAILIRFAQTENMLEAMNPLAAIALVAAIGLPYGLLIVFILIMMTSVGVLHQWIGALFPAASYLLQSVVSNYYSVVIFHLMGYILFQYQDQLGYRARASDDSQTPQRSDCERINAKILVLLKEGDYERVIDLYTYAIKKYPDEDVFFEKYFDLLYAFKKSDLIKKYALVYLAFLNRKKRFDKLLPTYKQILLIAPDYLPDSPSLRVQLATRCKHLGDLKLAVKLLNGLHKLYPDFIGLPDAYLLLADTLVQMPNMQEQSQKCRQMADHLRKKIEQQQTAIAKQNSAIKPTSKQNNSTTVNPGVTPSQTKYTTKSGIELALVPLEKEGVET